MFIAMHLCRSLFFCVSVVINHIMVLCEHDLFTNFSDLMHSSFSSSNYRSYLQMEYSFSYYHWYLGHLSSRWEFPTHCLQWLSGGTFILLIWVIEHYHFFQTRKYFYFLLRQYWYCMFSTMLDILLDLVSMHLE